MNSNPYNIFFVVHVLEIDFHLRGYSGNKQ